MKFSEEKVYQLLIVAIIAGFISKFSLLISYFLCFIAILMFFKLKLRILILSVSILLFLLNNYVTVIVDTKDGSKTNTYYSLSGKFKSPESYFVGDIIIGKKASKNRYTIDVNPAFVVEIPVISNILKFREAFGERLYTKSGAKLTLIQGLILGDKSKISNSTKDKFTYLGLNHYLAISGLHIGIIAVILITLMPKIHLKLKLIIVSILLIFFSILTGFKIPVIRSVIFFVILTYTYLFDIKVNFKKFVIFVGSIFILVYPPTIFNLSFVLSFSAVLGIAFIANKDKNFLYNTVVTSIAATLFTLPFVLYFFKMYNMLAVFNTIIIFPLIYLHIICGVFSIFFENIMIAPMILNENIIDITLDKLISLERYFFITNNISLPIFVIMLLVLLFSIVFDKKYLVFATVIFVFFKQDLPKDKIIFPNFVRSKAAIDLASDEIFFQGFYSDYRYKLIPYLIKNNIKLKFKKGKINIYDSNNIFIDLKENTDNLTNICINNKKSDCKFVYFTNKNNFKYEDYRHDKIYIVYNTELAGENIFTLKNKEELTFLIKGN